MATRARSFATAGALAAILVIATGIQVASPPRWSGEEWLSWTLEVRTVFVDAYLDGYVSGKMDACSTADDLFELDKPVQDPEDIVSARCLRHAKAYSKASDYYVKVITDFYTKYPKYGNIPYLNLMLLLRDDRYKTAEEIYQAALEGKIRTRF